MRMSKMSWIGAAVVLGSCAAVSALAQADPAQPPGGRQRRPGGFGQGGRFGGQLSLVSVNVDVLAKELKLTDEQKTSITAARTKMQTDMQAAFQPPADGSQPDRQAMQTKMQEINKTATKEIEAALKDDQKADAVVLLKNLQTLQTLRIPYQTYSDLKLTDDEKTKLGALAADAAKDRAAKMQEMQAARQAGDQEKMQQLMQSLRGTGQPDDKAMAALTADQKDLVTKYIKDHPQGRRPGGFGPGGGARAGGNAPPPQP